MKTIKVSELTGAALDRAVAKCGGYAEGLKPYRGADGTLYLATEHGYTHMESRNWAQGGPIIEREAITVSQGSPVLGLEWMACDRGSSCIQHGPTYLIAAMRCYVASKLGDTVEIPEELL